MALLPGSPARNGGDPKATDASGHLLTTDQRGFGRPTGDGTKPDIGAFQTQASSVLVFSTPATIVVGTPTTFTVTARDPLGNVVFDYSGTVHLSSSDAQAVLPVQCTLDQGVGTFTATLNSFGSQDLTATDLAHNKITGVSNLIVVNLATPSPPISTSLTFTVNNTLDDGSPGSLRWAILQANGNPGADTIAFDASVFGSPQKITLTSDLPALTDSALTTIQGPGANLLTIDGAGQYQVFLISSGASAWLSGLTISHGYTSDNGGGICNSGSLTVTTSTLSDNTAQSGSGIANDGTATVTTSILSDNSAQYGGGIGNWGTLTLRSCTLSGNSAIEWGGGIINGGTVTVTDSTLSDNSALVGGGISSGGTVTVMDSTLNDNYAQDGAGIDNVGAVTVTDSTLCGNSASSGFGGGIRNYAVLTVRSSTLSGNSALNGGGLYNYAYATVTVTCSTFSNNTAQEGGGIFNSNGSVTVTSTIVAGNQAGSGRDIFGWTDRGGHHNLIGGDPMLAPLGFYGGPTQTMALLPGSPARYGGDPKATDARSQPLTTDQRGFLRPTGPGATPDIGAFQTQAPTMVDRRVVASFGTNGLWCWSATGGWQQLSRLDAHTAVLASDGSIAAGFGTSGLWRWTSSGGWQLLSSLNDQTLVVAHDGALVAGFGASGLWRWTTIGGWQLLSSLYDQTLVAPSDGSLAAGFGAAGLWRWTTTSGWQVLSSLYDQTLVAAPDGSLVAGFGSAGLCAGIKAPGNPSAR